MSRTDSINLWPALLLTLLIFFLVFTFWSVQKAARDVSPVTDRDYYSHGLRYEDSLLERRAAATLGLRTETRLEGRILHLELRDAQGHPLGAAQATLALPTASAAASQRLALIEKSPGDYSAELPESLRGQNSLTLDIRTQGAGLQKKLLLSL